MVVLVLIGGVLFFGGVLLFFSAKYSSARFFEKTIRFLFEQGIQNFSHSFLGGVFRIKVRFSEAAMKQGFEERLDKFRKIFGEMLLINISRYPDSNLGIPRYMPFEIFGRKAIYELAPVVIRKAGIWFSDPKLKAWDYITTAENVGKLYPSRESAEDEAEFYFPPKTGYIGSFQMQHEKEGAEVDLGDVVMIIFSEVEPRSLLK